MNPVQTISLVVNLFEIYNCEERIKWKLDMENHKRLHSNKNEPEKME